MAKQYIPVTCRKASVETASDELGTYTDQNHLLVSMKVKLETHAEDTHLLGGPMIKIVS